MKAEKIAVSALRQHPDYIRGKCKTDYVNELALVLSDAKNIWPFPPIVVQPIPVNHADFKDDGRYWTIDGNHRCLAAAQVKLAEVPAEVISGLTPADAIAMQIKTNNAHGLRLSTSSQTNAIKKLAALDVKGTIIAEKTGLSRSTISRILSEKQRGPDNPEGTPGGSTDQRKKKIVKKFDADTWLKGLHRILKGWEKNGTKIRKTGLSEKCAKALDTLSNEIVDKEVE